MGLMAAVWHGKPNMQIAQIFQGKNHDNETLWPRSVEVVKTPILESYVEPIFALNPYVKLNPGSRQKLLNFLLDDDKPLAKKKCWNS